MKIPLEIYYHDIEKSDSIDALIREKTAKLEQVCDYITGCRVAIEKPHQFVRSGNAFRVRLDITVPPGHEIAVAKEPGKNKMHDPLAAVIRDAFEAARKQLKKLVDKQREEVKTSSKQEATAYVSEVFAEEGYGFIRATDGREIYFHKNSVTNNDFERIQPGTSVWFYEQTGEKGPQASTVQIVDNSGSRIVNPGEHIKNEESQQ